MYSNEVAVMKGVEQPPPSSIIQKDRRSMYGTHNLADALEGLPRRGSIQRRLGWGILPFIMFLASPPTFFARFCGDRETVSDFLTAPTLMLGCAPGEAICRRPLRFFRTKDNPAQIWRLSAKSHAFQSTSRNAPVPLKASFASRC